MPDEKKKKPSPAVGKVSEIKPKGVTMNLGSKEKNTPSTFKAGIMLDPVSFNLDKADITTANQLDALRTAITSVGQGGRDASRNRFSEVRNTPGSNITSFTANNKGGVSFRLAEHVSSLPGKRLGGTYVMNKSGSIFHTQGKNVAVSPYFKRIGVDPKI